MSKITIITASPRQDSNSTQMAKWFAEEAQQHGAEVGAEAKVEVKVGTGAASAAGAAVLHRRRYFR